MLFTPVFFNRHPHTLRKILILSLCLVVVVLISGVGMVFAQDTPEVVADGLFSPRGLSYDADGNLWIAESGYGGDYLVTEEGPFGPVFSGTTSQVTMVAPDGTKTLVLPFLPSTNSGGATGAVRVQATDDALWVLISEGAQFSFLSDTLIKLNRETLRIETMIDLFAYEQANNPDGTDEIYSNGSDFDVAPDGSIYITDTGANTILKWRETDGLSVFLTWDTNPVPSSLAFDANGDIWIGFIGQGVLPGMAKVERYTAAGELVEAYEGLNGITDVLVASDGSVYAVEMMLLVDEAPTPETGRVLKLNSGVGFEPIFEGLTFAYGIAEAPSGELLVSVGSLTMSAEQTGAVLKLPVR